MASNVENSDSARDVGRRDILVGGVAGAGFGAILLARRATAQTSETAAAPSAPPYVLPYVPKPAPTSYVFRIAESELNPDGEKTVAGIAVNGLFPGPEIRMTEGDMFRAQVENHLENEDTSLHWHGLLLPAVMDGVPDVAHKAIPPKQIQVFEFPPSDRDIASHRLTNALRSLGNTLKYWASANVCESMSLADFVSPCVSRRISWPEPSPFLNSCGT